MQGVFINLDRSTARRARMETRLHALGMDWVRRLPAVDGSLLEMPTACRISAGELGCFLSHLQAIESAPADAFNFVFEDDVELSTDLPLVLHPGQLEALAAYDLIVFECQPLGEYSVLAALWQTLERQLLDPSDLFDAHAPRRLKGVELYPGRNVYAWGAQGYVVTPRGRGRLAAVLRSCLALGPPGPVDILLRHAMEDGRINGVVLAPFLATPSLESYRESTMTNRPQSEDRLAIMSAMRRFFFAGPIGEMDANLEHLHARRPDISPQLHQLGRLVGSAFSMYVRDGSFIIDKDRGGTPS